MNISKVKTGVWTIFKTDENGTKCSLVDAKNYEFAKESVIGTYSKRPEFFSAAACEATIKALRKEGHLNVACQRVGWE